MEARRTLTDRLPRAEPKRLLALDGGGIRGLLEIEVLGRLETMLREATGDRDYVLADFFDYVAGTSTGAIVAVCIALGLPIDTIRNFYLAGGSEMFKPAPFWRQYYYRHRDAALSARLREELRHKDGRQDADRRLGDETLRTLLMVVMRNATTDSPWPISNNPYAKYNARSRDDCNLDLPLWQIIRASAAAPIYFPPQSIRIGSRTFTFVDGAVTVYNNPAFALFLMATLPEFKLEWEMGEERMLLVSIGTGVLGDDAKPLEAKQMGLLYNLKAVPSALIEAARVEQDKLCRVFGRCRFGGEIDREYGDLIVDEETATASGVGAFGPKKFTYVRYNPDLTPDGLRKLGFRGLKAADVQRLDSAKFLPQLMAVGRRYAEVVDFAHFGPFDPRHAA